MIFLKGLVFLQPDLVREAIDQFHAQKIPGYPKRFQPKIKKFFREYFVKNYLEKASFSGWSLHGQLSRYETTFTNNAIESYHHTIGELSGLGKNTVAKTCKVIYEYKEDNRLALRNGEFNARGKRCVEKHVNLQAFNYELSLFGPEFAKSNCLEIALKIGDILSPPDPSKPYKKHRTFSSFTFPAISH